MQNEHDLTIRISELIEGYMRFWSEPDEVQRHRLIERIWAEDAIYTDPLLETLYLTGREAINQLATDFQRRRPGDMIVLSSGIDYHHRNVRWESKWLAPDGTIVLEGIDIGELASDGRFQRVVAFWGPIPRMNSITSFDVQSLKVDRQ